MLLKLDQPAEAGVQVLKHSVRRSVFRVRNVTPELPSLVVKGFPLKKIELQVKYRKYGLAEFHHYQQAASRGIPVPACYGYFEVRFLGLVKANGVLLEDLADWRSLAELARDEPGKRLDILARAIPFIRKLYESGVNHVDVSLNNLLESKDGGQQRLIDWQYCSFTSPRRIAQLLLQASHYMNECGLLAGTDDGDSWLTTLHQSTGCPAPLDSFRRAVAALQAQKKITATERLSLALDPGRNLPDDVIQMMS